MSTNPTTVCRLPDGEICHRFSPGKEGDDLCLRCAHIEVCHTPLDKYAGGNTLLCWYRRDDKTVETCRKKFMNLDEGDIAQMAMLEPTDPIAVDQARRRADDQKMADWYRSRSGRDTLRRTMRNSRQSSTGARLEDHLEDDNCAILGCYPAPRAFEYPITGNPAYRITVEIDPALKPDRMIFRNDSAPGLTREGIERAQTHIAIMNGILRTAGDKDLHGFELRRIWLRPGEWKRLTRALARFEDDSPRRHYEPAQTGAFFVDGFGNVPVCENAFLPETMIVRPDPATATATATQMAEAEHSPRRVIGMLEYEKRGQMLYGRSIAPMGWLVEPEMRMRILTE